MGPSPSLTSSPTPPPPNRCCWVLPTRPSLTGWCRASPMLLPPLVLPSTPPQEKGGRGHHALLVAQPPRHRHRSLPSPTPLPSELIGVTPYAVPTEPPGAPFPPRPPRPPLPSPKTKPPAPPLPPLPPAPAVNVGAVGAVVAVGAGEDVETVTPLGPMLMTRNCLSEGAARAPASASTP